MDYQWTLGVRSDMGEVVDELDDGVAATEGEARAAASAALRFVAAVEGRREYHVRVGECWVIAMPGLTADGRVDLDGLDDSLREFLPVL